ncbi:hypothetical protein [Ranid herpesvirus 3]|uniref:Uncharacterized protein n=1 Tax=Ranid herpesvirus 3 TaxID=1987509 RepID=A0A1X9T5E0_9VIRU|nr:hypothetical protein [Ranid herpesvirus 3]ARR28913.1 hypothetical protein [Ranid herpesvirus 3]
MGNAQAVLSRALVMLLSCRKNVLPAYYTIKHHLPQVEKDQRELHRLAYGKSEWLAAHAALRVDNHNRALAMLDPANLEHQRLIKLARARLGSSTMLYKTTLGHLVNKDLVSDQYMMLHSNLNHIAQMKTIYDVSGIKRNDVEGYQKAIAKLEKKQALLEHNADALLTGVRDLIDESLEGQAATTLENFNHELESCDLAECLPNVPAQVLRVASPKPVVNHD